MLWRPWWGGWMVLAVGVACSTDTSSNTDATVRDAGGNIAQDTSRSQETTTGDTSGEPSRTEDTGLGFDIGFAPCQESLDLIVTADDLGYRRMYARILYEGEPAALLVDTGSQLTFLSALDAPDGTPDIGEVDFGCGPRSLLGRPFSAASEVVEAGLPVVGFVGSDFFASSLKRVDLNAKTVTPATEIHPEAVALTYEDVFGYMFVDVEIDGTPLKLGFDTGANHALWIGVDGQPGDTPINSVDGYGNPITLFLGSGELGWDTMPAVTVPVMRILEHRSIEDSDELIGVDAQGLFGLTTLPSGRFVIDGPNTTLWFEPEVSAP
ncbi:MAG: hypothetical protein AAFX99_04210 [Myxococcota bacterium]